LTPKKVQELGIKVVEGRATLLGQRSRRLRAFLVFQRRYFMVAGGVGVAWGGRKKGRKWGWQRGKKNLEKRWFLSNFAHWFLFWEWNQLLCKGGGRGTCVLYFCQILDLHSAWNDPNYWFNVAIMAWKSWLLKCAQVGYRACFKGVEGR